MRHITDPDLVKQMGHVEGPAWAKRMTPKILTMMGEDAVVEYEKHVKRAEHSGYKDQLESTASTGIIIYGEGGWNRWYVRGDGSIVFSKYHSQPKAQNLAYAMGFKLI